MSNPNFDQFRQMISEAGEIPMERIKPESKLVDDLGLDSIALMIVAVSILEEYSHDIPPGPSWNALTVKRLYDQVTRGPAT